MPGLAARACEPCRGGVPPLTSDEVRPLLAQIDADWEVVDGHHLARTYRFKNFREALAFTNAVGELAEAVNHHPDLHLAWGRVAVEIWTHKINGLHEADFIFAAKCDEL
jgi:4a-hydroxytetrahydrobiopterin dehydratase